MHWKNRLFTKSHVLKLKDLGDLKILLSMCKVKSILWPDTAAGEGEFRGRAERLGVA